MKLVLGTAQFGMNYGLSNFNGQTSSDEVLKILKYANDQKLNLLDTSPSYGNSEIVIGKLIENLNYKCVIKTPHFKENKIDKRHVEILKKSFIKSLSDLHQSLAYGLLIHSCDDLLKPGGNKLFEEMCRLKHLGLVNKIGVSVYNLEQIKSVLELFDIDIIQLPFNFFDQQLLLNGWLDRIKSKGIEIHSRSVFLQGLLLMNKESVPNFFSPISKSLELFENLSKELSISKLELALGYVMTISQIDKIIVGVNNINHLEEICSVNLIHLDPALMNQYTLKSSNYTNPSKWKL